MSSVSPHLSRLAAHSRPSGSAAAAEAQEYCAAVLRALDFKVSEHSFEYSAFVGRWVTPLAGALIPVLAVALSFARRLPIGFTFGLAAIVLAVGAAIRYVSRDGVLDLPVVRRRGVNLEAVRGGGEPRVWLVAHIDSKWQPMPMMGRVAGVVGAAIGLIALFALSFARANGADRTAWAFVGVSCLGAVPLILSYVGDRNHGAVDNASGVASVLEAAASIALSAQVGVLITDAEELGMAGATAWARSRSPGVAINCDGVDDHGQLILMHSKRVPSHLISRLVNAASESGEKLRTVRLIPGILTDHVALAAAGWQAVTLSRGDLRTLRRVHTSRDSLRFMRGTGIAKAARVLARTATELG